MIVWWGVLLISLGCVFLGGLIGFILTRKVIQKKMKENPPITANQIRAMYRQMGRTPSEKDVKKVIASMKRAK